MRWMCNHGLSTHFTIDSDQAIRKSLADVKYNVIKIQDR